MVKKYCVILLPFENTWIIILPGSSTRKTIHKNTGIVCKRVASESVTTIEFHMPWPQLGATHQEQNL